MSELKTINDVDVKGKRVLVRSDLDIPYKDGEITSDLRLKKAIRTVSELQKRGATVIMIGHFGRPKGVKVEELSLLPVSRRLQELLGLDVSFFSDNLGDPVKRALDNDLPKGGVALLENLRFYPGEEQNDPGFAQDLADLADVFVQDAFSASHRTHASTVGITNHIPSVAGITFQNEIETLSMILDNPKCPFVAAISGAKIKTKVGVIQRFLEVADHVLLGGIVANVVLAAKGMTMGTSPLDSGGEVLSASAIDLTSPKLHIPQDVVVAREAKAGIENRVVAAGAVPPGERVLDIGPDTARLYCDMMQGAQTVVWNGPMGVFEVPEFALGTKKLAECIAGQNAQTVIGGGDTIAAVEGFGLLDEFSHVSTGGGAMLKFIEDRDLPALTALG